MRSEDHVAVIRIITGPPCAGKTTHVQEKAAAGDIRVDFDRIASALGADTTHGAAGDIADAAFAARTAAVDHVLAGTKADAWIIHTQPSTDQVKAYEAAGAEFTHLDPGEAECLKRAEADGRPDTTLDAIRAWYQEPDAAPKATGAKSMATKKTVFLTKAAPSGVDGDGIITATASVFNNVDSYGDVVVPGAFADTLAEWKASGDPVPVIWNHDSADPFCHIGACTDIKETEVGLEFTAQLDMDNPTAAQAYRLMKGRRVKKFSFSYSVQERAFAEKDGQGVQELRKVKLFEVGPTLIGANDETELLDVKSAPETPAATVEEKAGKILSAKNEGLIKSAIDALTVLLESATPSSDESAAGKTASAGQEVKGEEPETANPEEPLAKASATDTRTLEHLIHAITLEKEITK
jgi:HK97 family phage prohead protease